MTGPTGPCCTGPTGDRGPTGSTGPQGTVFVPAYGSFYTQQDLVEIPAPASCLGPFSCRNYVPFTSVIQTSPTACPSLLAITLLNCTGATGTCLCGPSTTPFNEFMIQLPGIYLITCGVSSVAQSSTVGIVVNDLFVNGTGVPTGTSSTMTAFTAQLALNAGDRVAVANVGRADITIQDGPFGYCNSDSAFINFTYVGPICTTPP